MKVNLEKISKIYAQYDLIVLRIMGLNFCNGRNIVFNVFLAVCMVGISIVVGHIWVKLEFDKPQPIQKGPDFQTDQIGYLPNGP